MPVAIIGAGYAAQYLYYQLRDEHEIIYTISRSKSFLDNPEHICADLDDRHSLKHLLPLFANDLSLYYLAPPKPHGNIDTRVVNTLNYLEQQSLAQIRFIYISTSGVYGDKKGAWVNEETPVNPQTERAKRRVSAETLFLDFAKKYQSISAVVLRVPGIYGPNRLPIDKIKQRNKIISEQESGYTNLIHVKDLATVCIAAAKQGSDGEIYNVSDTQPLKSSAYYKRVAKLAKLDQPEEVDYATALEMFDKKRLSFLQESRRLDVKKMQSQLKPELAFTNLQTGILAAIQASD